MKRITWIVLGWLFLIISACANANDSIARVGAGGIMLVKTDNIRMIQEVLEISTKAVRVRYRFLNESTQDIQATVAFPMPPYGWNPGFSETMANVGPLESFHIWADGHLVPTQKNKVALIRGVDVTEQLRKIGLSDAQIFETFGDCIANEGDQTITCGLTEAQNKEIAKISSDGHSTSWKVAETAYWEQSFPAGKEIEVIHEYPPFVGSSYGYSNVITKSKNPTEACLDEGTQLAITKRIKALKDKGEDAAVTLDEVEYILGTGRNWKGTIKDFKLVIKKDSPGQIVSLCFPGKPKRTSPSTIEFSQSDFVPQDKLVVYFYTVANKVLPSPSQR